MDKIKAPAITENISLSIANQVKNIENYSNNIAGINNIETLDLTSNNSEEYIYSTQEVLSNNINTEQLTNAFTTLLGENGNSKIATNAEDAANGYFIESVNINAQYWTDNPLKFQLQENGTYLILQLNEDGNYIPMGYTTAEVASEYLKELSNIVNNVEDETSDVNNSTQTFIDNSKTSYITSNQLEENVRKEIMAYADADILNKGDKTEIYNNMSDTAKDIIDGKIKVLSPTENLGEIVDREMDIVIPENARVKIDDDYIVGLEGKTLKYDQEEKVYKVEGNTANIGGAKYTKLEMLTLEITETRG